MAYEKTNWTNGVTPLNATNLNKMEQGIYDAHQLINVVYPVGCYFETTDTDFDPNVSFGGTWTLETAGQFHISAGTGYEAGSTGGSADAIIPYHRHSVDAVSISSSGGHTHAVSVKYKESYGAGGSARELVNGLAGNPSSTGIASIASNTGAHTHSVPSHNTNYEGTDGNTTGANLPPYIAVNRWHRTA